MSTLRTAVERRARSILAGPVWRSTTPHIATLAEDARRETVGARRSISRSRFASFARSDVRRERTTSIVVVEV